MSKFVRAFVFVLAFACSAQAGWIQNGVTEPSPSVVASEPTAKGYIQNEEPASLTETVLSILETVLALL